MKRTFLLLLLLPLLVLACGEEEPLPTVAPASSEGGQTAENLAPRY
ncbi:MAG: hypothetical protein R3D55_26665 [Chloroflexota bacterium]